MIAKDKMAAGKIHKKVGVASWLSPQSLENQRGTAIGKLSLFTQIKAEEDKAKIRLPAKLRRLYF